MLWWTLRKLNGSPESRLAAIEALGRSHNRRAVEPLLRIIKEPWLRKGALLKYGIRVEDRHVEAQEKGKRAAVLALAELGDCGRAKPALIAALSDPVMTSTAANALRHLGHDPAEELRAQLTADRMGLELRRASAKALKEIGWVPGTPQERAWFFTCQGNYDQVSKERENAVDPLLAVLAESLQSVLHTDTQRIASAIIATDPQSSARSRLADCLAEGARRKLKDAATIGGGYGTDEVAGIVAILEKIGDQRADQFRAEIPGARQVPHWRERERIENAARRAAEEAEEAKRRREWPSKWENIKGRATTAFQVDNTSNNFEVLVGLRRFTTPKTYEFREGLDFAVPPFRTGQVAVPSGEYDVYYKYSTSDTVYKGDSVKLAGPGVIVSIVKRADGNYHIRGL